MGNRYDYAWANVDNEWKNYINFLEINEIFSICENRDIIELASNDSWHSRLILKYNPKSLTCIEPDSFFKDSLTELTNDFNNVKYFCGTANDFYNTPSTSADVVVCTGLLYHLSSPLHLIEQIINRSTPNFLIIETTSSPAIDISITPEIINANGNSHKDKNIEVMIPWCIGINDTTYINILKSVGYKCIKHIDYRYLDIIDHPSKEFCVMMIFEKEHYG